MSDVDLDEERRLYKERLQRKSKEYQERRNEGPTLLPIYRSWADGKPLAWSAPWVHKSLCYERRTWREHRENRHTTSIVNWVDSGASHPDVRPKTKLEIESALDLASESARGVGGASEAPDDTSD